MPVVGELLRRTVQPFVNSHRILLYGAATLIAVAVTVVNALRNHSNFYSVAIYLSRSSRSVLVFANLGVLLALASGKILQVLFFGPLLPAEVERLYDRIWFFVTESLLAFTIFRDEFDVPFGIMFGFLLFVKCFHWLMADRIEWMDQRPYPGPPPLFHVRILSLFTVLSLTDIVMFVFAIESTLNYGVGATVLFANEYAILAASSWNAMAKYGLSIYELRRASSRGGANAPPWEAKSMWLFYIELLTDFFKLSTYLVFFTVIMTFYGLPLNIIRDVYMTGASFISRLAAFHRYRTATRDMDQRYPDATAAELSGEADQTCIICREEMVVAAPDAPRAQQADGPNMTPKKLPCGHIFHFHCLRSWLERQQNCPTCRRPVLDNATPAGAAAPGQQRAVGPDGLPPPPARPQGQPRPWGLQAQNGAPGAPRANAPGNQGGIPGFIMRFFGAAQQPPLVPGQFGNGPLPPAAAVPAPPAAAPVAAAIPGFPPRAPRAPGQHPPGMVFEYNYVYEQGQGPRLMQPPLLQGFYREDGLWQGWPGVRGGRNMAPAPPAPAPVNGRDASLPQTPVISAAPVVPVDQPSTTPISLSNGSTGAISSNTAVENRADGVNTSLEGPASSNEPSSDSRPVAPRDAAALAALRRSATAGSKSGQQGSSSEPAATTSTSAAGAPPLVAPISSEALAASAQSASDPTPAPSATIDGNPPAPATPSAPTPISPSAIRADGVRTPLPTVIPLYDFGRPPASRGPSPLGSSPFSLTPTPTARPSRPAFPRAVTDGTLRTLPQPASDATLLAAADVDTREAIDARLRVLERVDGAIWRCVEELLRLRSVLPEPVAPQATTGPASTPATGATSGGGGPDTSQNKGKAIDPAERPGAPLVRVSSPPAESSTTTRIAESPAPAILEAPSATQPGLTDVVANQLSALAALSSTSLEGGNSGSIPGSENLLAAPAFAPERTIQDTGINETDALQDTREEQDNANQQSA